MWKMKDDNGDSYLLPYTRKFDTTPHLKLLPSHFESHDSKIQLMLSLMKEDTAART